MQATAVVPGFGRRISGTRAIASTLGVCVGVSGLDHGFFEMLQGNVATPGLIVTAIGPDQRMWIHGTEEAFTALPNFLAAGILTLMVAVLTIVWSIGFIDRPNGSRVLLLLGLLLFAVGGGVGMLAFLTFGWAVARHLDRPFTWGRPGPTGFGVRLAGPWPGLLVAGMALYVFALEVAIAGFVPGVSDPEAILLICWGSLLAMMAALVLALVGASAQDLASSTPTPDRTEATSSR
jgi:peptidoglycan/LPS O-acetylase OafA/YrhL